MQQNRQYNVDSASAICSYFDKATLPTQQETLGQIVVEILTDGKNLNRKSLCTKLLKRLEHSADHEEEKHYNELIGLLFENR
ncbi:regulatory protein YcgZ [Kluyvera genomosp. 1]|uniref:regulatory protein YcgZ n=1 Tax=Kluyvera genomosp. 1 TaxID=2774053 RepID=UPI0006918F52|nr:regulatory protein YcgZ [Kluyvera genomosp. 1]